MRSWPGTGPGSGSALSISSECRCGSGVEQGEGVRTGRDLLGLGQALGLEASPTTPANHRTLRREHSQDGLRAGRMQDPTLTLQASSCCPTCGRVRILPAAPAAPAAASVSHLTTNFLHELLDFTTATLWPHFRAQDYAASCNRSWVYPLEESNKLLLYAVLWAASYHRISCASHTVRLSRS